MDFLALDAPLALQKKIVFFLVADHRNAVWMPTQTIYIIAYSHCTMYTFSFVCFCYCQLKNWHPVY